MVRLYYDTFEQDMNSDDVCISLERYSPWPSTRKGKSNARPRKTEKSANFPGHKIVVESYHHNSMSRSLKPCNIFLSKKEKKEKNKKIELRVSKLDPSKGSPRVPFQSHWPARMWLPILLERAFRILGALLDAVVEAES